MRVIGSSWITESRSGHADEWILYDNGSSHLLCTYGGLELRVCGVRVCVAPGSQLLRGPGDMYYAASRPANRGARGYAAGASSAICPSM